MKKNLVILTIFAIMIAFSACSKETKTANELWESGMALYDVSNFKGAIKQYTRIVKSFPEDELAIKADFSIAEIYKNNLKDYDKAVNHYKTIQKKYPNSEKTPNAIFMIGYIYANEIKDINKAKSAYQYFIDTYPDNILVQSAEWEIKNLGKSLEEIQQTNITQ